jgi:Putative Ig domain
MPRVIFSAAKFSRRLSLRALTITVICAAATTYGSGDGLAIWGKPSATATVGQVYSFTPTAADPTGRKLSFAIVNKPAWATFSTQTGKLSGTPTRANIGTQANIRISVTDNVDTARLPEFSIKVAAATGVDKPVISGTPPTSVTAGGTYKFQPTAKDPDGKTLSFSVQHKPAWATFSIASGLLDGTPTSAQVGSYGDIIISASNGQYSSSLPPFNVAVTGTPPAGGNATVNWQPPTENTNGSALTDLAGIRIYYGTSPSSLSHMVQVASPTETSYTISNLAAGTWYFGGVAYTTSGVQSAMSAVVSTLVP